MGQRRYPGATPFSKEQSRIFYGRDNDIQRLLTLVRVERKVLLYGKSGLGKTSLLEAGVNPRLPDNFIPVSIRFYAKRPDSLTPVESVFTVLENTLGKLDDMPPTALDELETSEKERKTLWYYFKKLQLSQPAVPANQEPEANNADHDEHEEDIELEKNLPRTYVLVFDQFEELFSYSKAEVDEFKQQFYELTEQNVPERYAELIAPARRKNREKFNRKTLSEIHHKTNIKTVFAIRSDRLSQLNQLSDMITDIQQIFYEIKPLTNNQAKETIINPAKDPDPSFETSPYTFHPDAIEKVISELTDKGEQSIETTQLQIVCHRLEEIAEEERSRAPDKGQVEIQVQDLPNFKNIFLDFYEDSIHKLQEDSRDKAKRLIEDELIRSKQRISLDENICKEFLSAQELKILVDTHLLRSERNSFGRFSFELSHDTLVEPILESRKKFKDKEEKLRMEQQEKERQKKLRRQRMISLTFAVSFIISLVLLVVAYKSYNEAEAQKKEAIKNQQRAIESIITSTSKDISNSKTKAQSEIGNLEYQVAITYYEQAKGIIKNLNLDEIVGSDPPDDKSAVSGILKYLSKIMPSGGEKDTSFVEMQEFIPKIKKSIHEIKNDTVDINDTIKILETRIKAGKEIRSALAAADKLSEATNFEMALDTCEYAIRLDKNRPEAKRKFNAIRAFAIEKYEDLVEFYQQEDVKKPAKEQEARNRLMYFRSIPRKEIP